jgi:serine/threonine protein kinase
LKPSWAREGWASDRLSRAGHPSGPIRRGQSAAFHRRRERRPAGALLPGGEIRLGLSNRHIVTIFDIDTGQVDGQPVDFIAMEYVAGKTLDRLIGRKGIRLNDALRYAIQIADGWRPRTARASYTAI